MTRQQIINRISELDFWLTHNHTHTNYSIVLKDKKVLESQLETTEEYERRD